MALDSEDGCVAFSFVLFFYLVLIVAVVSGAIYLAHHIH